MTRVCRTDFSPFVSWSCLNRLLFPLATPLDESPQDDAAAKANAPLTRETDLVVLYSDLENIFDEEDELGVSEGSIKKEGEVFLLHTITGMKQKNFNFFRMGLMSTFVFITKDNQGVGNQMERVRGVLGPFTHIKRSGMIKGVARNFSLPCLLYIQYKKGEKMIKLGFLCCCCFKVDEIRTSRVNSLK